MEQANSSAAQQHTKDSPACNKDYKDKDAMSRASNEHQLPISWHLRDVTAMIHARTARAANTMININSRAFELGYDPEFMTFDTSPPPDSRLKPTTSPHPDSGFKLTTSQRPTSTTHRPTANRSSLPTSSRCWGNVTSMIGNPLAIPTSSHPQAS